MSKFDPPRIDTTGNSPARRLELEFEPLSEARWSKIEQRVFSRLDAGEFPLTRDSRQPAPFSTRRATVWGLGLAASVLLVGVAFSRSNRSAAPTVSRISTGVAASHVALPGVVLDVSPLSAVLVSGNAEESALIVLDRGEVTFDVAHRRPGAPLFVQAGELSVEVVGTRFTVTRQEDVARVVVQEGVVRVRLRGSVTSVKAGETWPPARTAAAGAVPSADPVSQPNDPPETVSPTDHPVAPLRPREAARPRTVKEAKEVKAERTEKVPTAETLPPSVQQQFELATRIEAKEPGEAIRLYEGIESSSNGWSANALFAHGRLEAARGNRAAARRILTQYLKRFPTGANAPDARLLLSRLE